LSNSNTNNEIIYEDEQAVNPTVAAGTAEDHPVLVNKDVGFIKFSATGQASIGQLLKEAMVRLGSNCFQNADANFAKRRIGKQSHCDRYDTELVRKTAEKRHRRSTNMVDVFSTQTRSFLLLLLAVSKQPIELQAIV
jgi:hypothetical protein